MRTAFAHNRAAVDAEDLAPLLGLDRDKMHADENISPCETGQGAEAGRLRVAFFHRGDRVSLICAADSNVLSKLRIPARKRT